MHEHDICVFVETKLTDLDNINLPDDFDYVTKNRKQFKKASGGIVVIYKKGLGKNLKFYETESQFVLWFQISKSVLSLNFDVLFGCVYIPPENSKYSTLEAFEELENELDTLSKVEKLYVALIGDFNAKTSSLPDYVIPDESIVSLFDLDYDADILAYLYDFQELTQNNISLQRVSKCACRPNNYGNRLLEMCKKNNIYIANSRIGLDKDKGEKTCNDSSVVDYLIVSSKVFPFIPTFEICDFLPLYSDCHCMIKFSLQATINDDHPTVQVGMRESVFIKWKTENKSEYVNHVHDDSNGNIESVMNKLNEISANNITQIEMNNIVLDINQIFTNAAEETFGKTGTRKKYYKHKDSKPWFNRKCSISRKKFHKARKRYSFLKNAENRRKMRLASKEHKTTLNNAFVNYQQRAADELRKMSKKDTKGLWKILNKLNRNHKQGDNDGISLQALYDHFKALNERGETEDDQEPDFNFDNISDEIELFLNGPIIEEEIKKVVSNLKNGKAFGNDGILNEYIKSTIDDLMPVYIKLFNLILDTGIIPDNWSTGIMITIFKNKGSRSDPEMYRGITLNSCFSKTFSSILNNRLNIYAEHVDLVTRAQAGFRKGFSTVDNIFVLYALITIYFSFGKKLYCTFVDFKSAFDTVWRSGLWQKMQKSNIKGKIFTVIYNMYQNIKTCVKKGNEFSQFFISHIGVKQGENLSPFLFSLFLNDLENFFTEKNVECLGKISNLCQESLQIYVKLFLILYADDTALLSESPEGLQETLTYFEKYCDNWKLKVNRSKTKVVVFSKKKVRHNQNFKLYGENIEIVDAYSYLGILFNFNGSFCKARKKLVEQAQKALFALYRKIKNICIPIDLQLKLFDSLVSPVLMYASEVWGFENKDTIEKMHLQFCKNILKVRSSTPNYMVYGELGRFPMETIIKRKIVLFWNSLLLENNKLSSIMYKTMLALHLQFPQKFKWVSYVKSIFDENGLSFIWEGQIPMDRSALKKLISQQLNDQFIQQWFAQMGNSSRGNFYSEYKTEFGLEKYLLRLNQCDRLYIAKLRCSNLKIPIETGRWTKVPKEERICHLCGNGLGDEFHYLFVCENEDLKKFRKKYIPSYYTVTPRDYKLKRLLMFCNVELYKNLAKYLKILIRTI